MARLSVGAADCAIGDNIRTRRLLAGLSQEALGVRIGVTFQQIQKYETGANRVAATTLMKIADAVDVPVAALLELQAQPTGGLMLVPHDPIPAVSAPRPVRNAVLDGEVLTLVQRFRAIGSPLQRRQVLNIVRTIASTEVAAS